MDAAEKETFRVIVKEKCFVQGGLREPGMPEPFGEFMYTGSRDKLPRSLVPADGVTAAPAASGEGSSASGEGSGKAGDTGLTKAEIQAQLVAAGVTFDVRANKPELLELLNKARAEAAPAASGAPDKSEGLV